jgi:hypothetical protein
MPLRSYDRFFGGKKGAASKAHAAMIAHYGYAKGTRIFYAKINDERAKQRK